MTEKTMKLLEERVQENLEVLLDEGWDMAPAKRTAIVEEANSILDRLIQAEKDNADAWDKDQRRKIEIRKNKDAAEIEKLKITSMPWKRAAVEIAKVTIPAILSGGLFWAAQTRVLNFEETGRFTSTASKQLGAPRIFK